MNIRRYFNREPREDYSFLSGFNSALIDYATSLGDDDKRQFLVWQTFRAGRRAMMHPQLRSEMFDAISGCSIISQEAALTAVETLKNIPITDYNARRWVEAAARQIASPERQYNGQYPPCLIPPYDIDG